LIELGYDAQFKSHVGHVMHFSSKLTENTNGGDKLKV